MKPLQPLLLSGRLALILPLLALLAASPARHSQQNWVKIGDRTVNYTVDHSEIIFDDVQKDLSAIRVKVRKGAINLHRCAIYYDNGQTQDMDIMNSIPQGGESKVLELPADSRTITKLVFTYDTKNRTAQKSEVEIWGRTK
jgi:hypothetical protein